jgi:hypothetical protein
LMYGRIATRLGPASVIWQCKSRKLNTRAKEAVHHFFVQLPSCYTC